MNSDFYNNHPLFLNPNADDVVKFDVSKRPERKPRDRSSLNIEVEMTISLESSLMKSDLRDLHRCGAGFGFDLMAN